MELVTEVYLLNNGFKKLPQGIGWTIFSKGYFDIIQVPLKKGGFTFAFAFESKHETQYKYPLTTSELEILHKILIGKEL